MLKVNVTQTWCVLRTVRAAASTEDTHLPRVPRLILLRVALTDNNACCSNAILNPEVPHALRLQSILMGALTTAVCPQ